MKPPATRSRFIPWQFSLRSLLLLMFLIGVGLVIYRWPWEVHIGYGDFTTYRRGWNGKPVKHGPQEMSHRTELNLTWYVDDDLRLARIWIFEEVVSETRFLAGKKHGLCWTLADGVREIGNYRAGLKHGEWERVCRDGTVHEQWADDQLHGRRVWLSPAGKELQAADYKQGRLVKWNGQPLRPEMQRWLATRAPDDSRLQHLLFKPVHSASDLAGAKGHYGEVVFRIDAKERLMVHWETFDPWNWRGPQWKDPAWQERFLGEALLEYSLEHSARWEYRYGLLTMVPIDEQSLGWQDRTGVDDVKFKHGSPQQEYWQGVATTCPLRDRYLPDRLSWIFPHSDGQPIELDLSPIDYDDSPRMGGGPSARHIMPRPRRDLLGHHLNLEKCYCVQQGNRLIIKRHE